MSNLTNLQRKIVFALGIVVIFAAMYPYKEYLKGRAIKTNLGEATIGEIDSGSFMLKLALIGGARGIAANVLWTKAIDLQKVQDWDRLKQTVDNITKLQPHFLSVWTFQGWNLAYNVSVEWDAPEDKYEWIKQGIKFLQDGVKKNQRSPDLIWDTAWTYYHKLGFADETIILRRLFRDDPEEGFKRDPVGESVIYNDNFQLAGGWFTKAVRLVDSGEARSQEGTEETVEFVDAPIQRKGRPGDLAFRSMPAHSATRYASGLEKESMKGIPATFGEVAKNEWGKALEEWVKFGRYTFKSHNEMLRNGKLERDDIVIDDATEPSRYDKLNDNQKYWTFRWADQMNYPYWKDRCMAEMESEGVEARRYFYEATRAYKSAEFPTAVSLYSKGLKIWDDLLKRHPNYRNDDLNKKDTGLVLKRYARACQQMGTELPKDTPFQDLLAATANDNTVDPFDALEMIGVNAAAEGKATPLAPSTGGTAPPPGK